MTESSSSESAVKRRAGKYLTLTLSGEQYGIPILKVVEIFGVVKITRVPRCPDYVKGVINLRGKIIPVVDLRLKFSLQEQEANRETCIIVVKVCFGEDELTLGMIVDSVVEVRDFEESSIAPAPSYGSGLDTRFITGIGKHEGDEVTILMDIDKIFEEQDGDMLLPLSQTEE